MIAVSIPTLEELDKAMEEKWGGVERAKAAKEQAERDEQVADEKRAAYLNRTGKEETKT